MSCQYILCGKTRSEFPDLQLFPFPNDPDFRTEWIKRCGNFKLLREEYADQTLYLCSKHFSEKQYKGKRKNSNALRENAKPYVYGRNYVAVYTHFMEQFQHDPQSISTELEKEEDRQPRVSKSANVRTYDGSKPPLKALDTLVTVADSSEIDLPAHGSETHTLYEIDSKTSEASDNGLLSPEDIVLITHRIVHRPLKPERTGLNDSMKNGRSTSSLDETSVHQESTDVGIEDIKKDSRLSNSVEIVSCNTSNIVEYVCEKEAIDIEIHDVKGDSNLLELVSNHSSNIVEKTVSKGQKPITTANAEPCLGVRNKTAEPKKPYFRGLKTYYSCDRILTDVCRICLLPIATKDFVKLFEDHVRSGRLKTMLKMVLPHLDLELYQNCAVCLQCETSLKYSYHLKLNSAKTEVNLMKIIKQNSRVTKRDVDLVIGKVKPNLKFYNIAQSVDDSTTALSTENCEVENQPVKKHLCHQCGQVYITPFRLKMHLEKCMKPRKIINKPKKKIMCEKCGELLYSRRDYMAHLETHNIHKCNSCNRIYPNKNALKVHINWRHLKLNERLCHICGKQTSRLLLHMNSHNVKGRKIFYCRICRRQFNTQDLLKKHNSKKHQTVDKKKWRNEFQKVVCEFCGKFITIHNLKKHTTVVHKKDSKFVCNNCKQAFWTEKALVRHRIVKHGFGPEKS